LSLKNHHTFDSLQFSEPSPQYARVHNCSQSHTTMWTGLNIREGK